MRNSNTTKFVILLAAIAAARCVAAVTFPLLSSEAYYWLWGQHPAAGYFDHPPMVALMSAISFGWIKGSELAARSSPIILGLSSTIVLYLLTKELFGSTRTALRAAALFSIVPIFDAGGVILQPDNSLLFFTLLTWLFSWRAMKRPESFGWWWAVGVSAGLALLSKFHAWVILPALFLFLMVSREHRSIFTKPGPWAALLLALAVLSPNLWWNAQHGWLTYAYQTHRSGLSEGGLNLSYVASYLLGPLITLSPLVYVAMIVGVLTGFRLWRTSRNPAILYLLTIGLPLPLFLGILSTSTSISLHWPAVGYAPLLVLLVHLAESGKLFGRGYLKAMWASCLAFALLLHLTPAIAKTIPADLGLPFFSDKIQAKRLKAEFKNLSAAGDRLKTQSERLSKDGPTVILTPDFHLAALLAFYLNDSESVSVFLNKRSHQFILWRDDPAAPIPHNAIVVIPYRDKEDITPEGDENGKEYYSVIREEFERFEFGPALVFSEDGKTVSEQIPAEVKGDETKYLLVFAYGYKNVRDTKKMW